MFEEFTDFLISQEQDLRLIAFFGGLALMSLVEAVWPRRNRLLSRARRWSSNLGLTFLNTVFVRLIFPLVAVGMAWEAHFAGWGVLNMVALPDWTEFLVAVLVLDLAIWAQHVAMHHVPILWRMHRMHHSDIDLDATSGARFHPFEICLSLAYKLALIALLGAPVAAVILFEILLSTGAIFNHANVRLPKKLDQLMRLIIVTPDMHRVHHSSTRRETNSNYGFFVPWWDRLFGTYVAEPALGHQNMVVGLEYLRSPKEARLDQLLIQPLRSPKED